MMRNLGAVAGVCLWRKEVGNKPKKAWLGKKARQFGNN